MERLEILLEFAEEALSTEQRRHIVGGILLSVSLLFGSLAITVMVMDRKEKE